MAKKVRKLRKSPKDPAATPPQAAAENDALTSPVCYANAPELRPEFIAVTALPAKQKTAPAAAAKPKTDKSG